MTTHLSFRLAWHDRGWDGHICNAPHLNASCIVFDRIREGRNDEEERQRAGQRLPSPDAGDLETYRPPCTSEIGAWSSTPHLVVHHDPLFRPHGRPTPVVLPLYSFSPTPYRWLREENLDEILRAERMSLPPPTRPRERGWVSDPQRERMLLDRFWGKLEPGKSLVFFYCKQGTPVDDNTSRVVVGVGRIAAVGEQRFFRADSGKDRPLIWPRSVTQCYPQEGVRLPYQEYINAGAPVDSILCRVPPSATPDFSYVGEHVSDDVAVGVLENIIRSVQQVANDGIVPGRWDEHLKWLDTCLAQVWHDRGLYPALGNLLQYLGCDRGTAYQRAVLAPMERAGADPWVHVRAILDGCREPDDDEYRVGMMKAREFWEKITTRHALVDRLVRFALTTVQLRRALDADKRPEMGIVATHAATGGKSIHPRGD